MPQGYPQWPGPREAEPGTTYTRSNPDPEGDGNVFTVAEIETRDDGTVTVTGRFETR